VGTHGAGSCLSAGHTLHHVALGLPAKDWAPYSVHMALGIRWQWPTPAPHFSTPNAWVMALDPRGMGLTSRPPINKSSIKTQFYWVLYQEPRFHDPRILNIIFCFRNIIIFIIITIFNKIINKFHRKLLLLILKTYYHLYSNFLWYFFYKNKRWARD
jgi:hypothetical protein